MFQSYKQYILQVLLSKEIIIPINHVLLKIQLQLL